MKNKKVLVYLLGLSVLTIWGMILYRIYNASHQDQTPVGWVKQRNESRKLSVPEWQPDTFQLLRSYKDPFAEYSTAADQRVVAVNNEPKEHAAIRPVAASSFATLPADLKYVGFIRNAVNRQKIAIIHYKGMDRMFVEGQRMAELKILFISSEVIKVNYNGELNSIRRYEN